MIIQSAAASKADIPIKYEPMYSSYEMLLFYTFFADFCHSRAIKPINVQLRDAKLTLYWHRKQISL